MSEEFILKIIGNVGAPAVICLYTLFEVNKNVKRLAESIDRLSDNVNRRVDKVEDDLHTLTLEVKTLLRRNGRDV